MKISKVTHVELSNRDREHLNQAYHILEDIYKGLGIGGNYQSVVTGEIIGEMNIPIALGVLSGVLETAVWEKLEK